MEDQYVKEFIALDGAKCMRRTGLRDSKNVPLYYCGLPVTVTSPITVVNIPSPSDSGSNIDWLI